MVRGATDGSMGSSPLRSVGFRGLVSLILADLSGQGLAHGGMKLSTRPLPLIRVLGQGNCAKRTKSLSAAHEPHVPGIALIVVVDVAIAEVDVPRAVVGIVWHRARTTKTSRLLAYWGKTGR
jgi:hypothetical protein